MRQAMTRVRNKRALGPEGHRRGDIRPMYDALFAAFGAQHWWPAESIAEIIVGAILTQNTAWTNVERAIARLKVEHLLSFAKLHVISEAALADCIRPAGTFRVKARRIKDFVDWMHATYDGDANAMFATDGDVLRRQLLEVPGIGPETADAILLYAGGVPTFVVDAYTRRIARRHYLIHANADYASTKDVFESAVPPDARVYGEFHALLVALGKRHCGRDARCDGCPLERFEHDAGR